MTNEIPPEIEHRIQPYLESGKYQSELDVLRNAMELLDDENGRSTRWHEKNQISMEQSKRGLSKPLDDKAVLERLKKRLENS